MPCPLKNTRYTFAEAQRFAVPVVYGLLDDAGLFYVGKTSAAAKRFANHRQARTKNARLKHRLLNPVGCVRVTVIDVDPIDINGAERAAIRKRESCILNLIGADSSAWEQHSPVPWAVGTGNLSPTAMVLSGMKRGSPKAVIRRWLAGLSDAERCAAEVETYLSFPVYLRKRLDKWLDKATPKLFACMEGGCARP